LEANKVIARNSIVLYVKLIITSVLGLLTSRFIIQALGASDFGLYNVVGSVVFMMAFLNNIMVTTTYRFIAFEMGQGELQSVNKVFNVSLVIHIILAVLVLIFAEVIGVYYINNYLKVEPGKLDDALFVFRFSVLSTIVSILSVPYQGLIIAKEKFVAASIIEISRSILALGVVLLILFYSGDKLRLYSALIALVTIFPSVLFYLYSRKVFDIETRWNFQKDKSKYKEMAFFSGWVMFGAAASAAEIQVSVILINSFFGTLINASYGIANQVNNLVKMFAQSVNQSFIPQITKSISGGDEKRSLDLVIFSSKYSFFLILFPSLPILLETDYILKLWIKDVPAYTAILVQLFILTAMVRTMNAGIPALVQATGRIKYFQMVSSFLVLSGLPISYYFFKSGLPPYMLSFVFLLIAVLDLFIVQILLKKILDFDILDFFKRVYLKIILVFLFVLPLFAVQLIFPSSFLRFILLSSGSIVFILIAVYFFGMDRAEKEFVNNFLKNKFDKY
jgi:O-antigen/teichoic acid export membrane protein